MATTSNIEWTEQTWNPVVGCTKVSQGCKHCYAERLAVRLQAMGAPGYENGFEVSLVPERLDQPLRRRKPTVYFVNSMSDLFHEEIPDAFISRVFDTIRAAPQHTFQILTKRAERMAGYFQNHDAPPPNAWLGVSVENRKQGLPRIPLLRSVPAAVRFLSIEPLLEDLGQFSLDAIHWVIVGGESGPQARRMDPRWVARIQEQCTAADVPFFFKQWGGWGEDGVQRPKKKNGRIFLDRTWDAMPSLQPCAQELA